MTADELDDLSRYPLFPKGARTLVELLGAKATAALITAWPGQRFPVPTQIGGTAPAGKRRWAQLVSVVGEASAKKVVAYCGGGDLEVPSCKEAIHQRLQGLIRERYDALIRNGYSAPEAVFEVGIAFNMSGKTIERIVNAPAPELICTAQGCLF